MVDGAATASGAAISTISVDVDDVGEIGMLQSGINEMVAGLRERERIQDLFGRHVGPAVAEEAIRGGVTLGAARTATSSRCSSTSPGRPR